MEKTIDMRFMKKMLTLIIAMGAIFGMGMLTGCNSKQTADPVVYGNSKQTADLVVYGNILLPRNYKNS